VIKLKAITTTANRAGLSARKHKAAIVLARDIAAAGALKDFEGAVRTWRHKPSFRITRDEDSTSVGTDDKIFGYVDGGTRPHLIRPKKKRLRFQTGFSAKSSPGSLSSGRGGRSGPFVFARVVRHPGTKARNFSKLVNERAQTLLTAETARQIAQAAAKG
jgi:hypothetical protein